MWTLLSRRSPKYFDEFTKKHYEKIQRGLNLSDDDLKKVMEQITKLNPKPGRPCQRGE
jgi:RNA polymerase sigma-54 factor